MFAELNIEGKFNPLHFIKSWRQFIDAGCGEIWMLLHNDAPVGALGLINTLNLFTGDSECTMMFWFVLPEHRGQRGALKLLSKFLNSKVRKLSVNLTKEYSNERVQSYLRRFGFANTGTAYTRYL